MISLVKLLQPNTVIIIIIIIIVEMDCYKLIHNKCNSVERNIEELL